MASRKLTLFGRPACHLCGDMLLQLQALQDAGKVFDVDYVDIDTRKELQALYGQRIPVLVDAKTGHEICHYHLDKDALLAVLT